MAQVKKAVIVEYTPSQMFRVVDDVERYPEFLPWCAGTQVVTCTPTRTRATVLINYHHIKQSFTTENTKQFPESIEIALVNGPFRKLEGSWRFIPLGDEACKIEFRLSYEFSSKVFEALVGRVFDYIANTLVEAFVERAVTMYPK